MSELKKLVPKMVSTPPVILETTDLDKSRRYTSVIGFFNETGTSLTKKICLDYKNNIREVIDYNADEEIHFKFDNFFEPNKIEVEIYKNRGEGFKRTTVQLDKDFLYDGAECIYTNKSGFPTSQNTWKKGLLIKPR